MQKTYKPKIFALSPLVTVLILLAALALSSGCSKLLHGDVLNACGNLLAVCVLLAMVWISSGDYRKYQNIEVDEEKIFIAPVGGVCWREITAIKFGVLGMTPLLGMSKGKEEIVIPLEAYQNKFDLMLSISRCCEHLAWAPPTELEYYNKKYAGVCLGLLIIALLLALIFGVLGICSYKYQVDYVMVLSAIIFACGTVIANAGISIIRMNEENVLRFEYIPLAFGALLIAGALIYACYKNPSILVLGFGIASICVWGIIFYCRVKAKIEP